MRPERFKLFQKLLSSKLISKSKQASEFLLVRIHPKRFALFVLDTEHSYNNGDTVKKIIVKIFHIDRGNIAQMSFVFDDFGLRGDYSLDAGQWVRNGLICNYSNELLEVIKGQIDDYLSFYQY